MTEPTLERWLADPQADPELRQLLEAGRSERPRSQALRMAPLVISTLLTVQAAAVAAPLTGAKVAAAPLAAGAARHAITTAILKWLAGGMLVGAAALSASQALEPAQPVAPAVVQSAALAARPRVSARPATPLPATMEPVLAAPEPSAAPIKVPAPRGDVAREVALLDAARVALLQGDARRALDALSGLDRLRAPSLAPEATVLRVRSLLALGDVETARKVAARFVATAPKSPQASVLSALIAEPLETKVNDSALRDHERAIQTEASEL